MMTMFDAIAILCFIGLFLAAGNFVMEMCFTLFPSLQDRFNKLCGRVLEVKFSVPQYAFDEFKRGITSTDFKSDNAMFSTLTTPGKTYTPNDIRYCRFSSEYKNDIDRAIALLPSCGNVYGRIHSD